MSRQIKAAADLAVAFETMAARIKANLPADFGGAMVIVGPTGEVKIEGLILDPSGDEAAFWSVASAKVEAAKNEYLMNEQQKTAGYGGMSRR